MSPVFLKYTLDYSGFSIYLFWFFTVLPSVPSATFECINLQQLIGAPQVFLLILVVCQESSISCNLERMFCGGMLWKRRNLGYYSFFHLPSFIPILIEISWIVSSGFFFDWGQMTGIGKEKTIWSFLVPVNMLYRYSYWQMVTVYFVNSDVRCQIRESRTGWLIKNLIHLTFHVGFFFFLQSWSLNVGVFFTNLESEYGFLERETKIIWRCISVIANFRIKWWAGTLISSMFASRTMRWIWIYASLAESKNFSFVA